MISQQHCNITTSGVQYNYGKDIITLASEAMILTVMNAILVIEWRSLKN